MMDIHAERVDGVRAWMARQPRPARLRVGDVCREKGICYMTLYRSTRNVGTSFWSLRREAIVGRLREALVRRPRLNAEGAASEAGFPSRLAMLVYLERVGENWSRLKSAAKGGTGAGFSEG